MLSDYLIKQPPPLCPVDALSYPSSTLCYTYYHLRAHAILNISTLLIADKT